MADSKKYEDLLLMSSEEIAQEEAELKAQEAQYKTEDLRNSLRLEISKLKRQLDAAKRAEDFDAEQIVDLRDEIALTERRLEGIQEVHDELF